MITKLSICLILFLVMQSLLASSAESSFENIILLGNEQDLEIISHVLWQFDQEIADFQKAIGSYLDSKITIRIAADKKEYQAWTKDTSSIIEFSLAFYDRQRESIQLRHPSEIRSLTLLRKILLHEYIHHYVDKFWKNPPLWFNEGMAVYFSGDMGFDRELSFARNYILGNSRPLHLMRYNYPRNQIEWESFYAKSALAVKYLYNEKREEFYRLWDFAESEEDFYSAFQKAFYMSEYEFSAFFENFAKTRFRIEILLASTGIIWSLLPLLLIVGVIRKKIRNRRQRIEWSKEEENISDLNAGEDSSSKYSEQTQNDRTKEDNERI